MVRPRILFDCPDNRPDGSLFGYRESSRVDFLVAPMIVTMFFKVWLSRWFRKVVLMVVPMFFALP